MPSVPDKDEQLENQSRPVRIFCDREDGVPVAFEVQSYLGGSKPVYLVLPFPPTIQLRAPSDEFAGDAMVDDAKFMRRKPAKDAEGNNLAFVLDEVDHHVMGARKHFRPPASGDEDSPKTIYDYIEAKVGADPDVMAWLGFN